MCRLISSAPSGPEPERVQMKGLPLSGPNQQLPLLTKQLNNGLQPAAGTGDRMCSP
jgi:hypothetical protein